MSKGAASKKQIAYDYIKNKILDGEWKTGESIVERVLCENLEISRTPIRAALAELSEEGLVDLVSGQGVFVSKIRFEDMIEVYDIREALECMSVKLLTERATAEELAHLEEILGRMEQASGGEFMTLDMEMHTTMAVYSKNKRLARNIAQIYSPIRLMASTAQNDGELRASALADHRDINQAIAARDEDKAVQTMRKHILDVKEYHIKHYFLFTSS